MAQTKKQRALSTQARGALSALLKEVGETEAANRLGVARNTLARAAAGFGLQPGTVALIERELGKAVAS